MINIRRRLITALCAGIAILFVQLYILICEEVYHKRAKSFPSCHVPLDGNTEYTLLNRDMRNLVRPREETTRIEPQNVWCSWKEDIFLVMAVMSDASHFEYRQVIRDTWGRDLLRFRPDMRLIFILGVPNNMTIQGHIEKEAEAYNDILQEDFCDSYFNVTVKVVLTLKWLLSSCPRAKFIMKTDDDNFVHPTNIMNMLFRHAYRGEDGWRKYLLTGSVRHDIKPVRDLNSNFFVPKYVFEPDEYPPFIFGSAYVFSGSLIKSLYRSSLDAPFIHLDDVFLTGIVAGKRLGLTLEHNPGFRITRTCDLTNVIQVPEFPIGMLRTLWKNNSQDLIRFGFENPC